MKKLLCFLGLHKWEGIRDLAFIMTGKIHWYKCIHCGKNKY